MFSMGPRLPPMKGLRSNARKLCACSAKARGELVAPMELLHAWVLIGPRFFPASRSSALTPVSTPNRVPHFTEHSSFVPTRFREDLYWIEESPRGGPRVHSRIASDRLHPCGYRGAGVVT